MSEYTLQVSSIFSKKNWNINASEDKESLSKMINLGSSLTDDEREMLVALLSKYIKISFNDYVNKLLDSINIMDETKFTGIKDFYILPLKRPEDFKKTKSSDTISYLLCNIPIFRNTKLFLNKSLNLISYDNIPKKISTTQTKQLILVDDFAGSGNTALQCLDYLNLTMGIPKNKMTSIFMCMMSQSYRILKSNGYEVYSNVLLEKGISDIQDLQIKKKYTSLMNELESKFDFRECDRFGYDKVESLITFIKTPNNTFPIFWDGKRNKNAPFERK